MNKEIENELKKSRVDFVHFVDISKLTNRQNRGLPCAILIGIAISSKFVITKLRKECNLLEMSVG